jgi:DnaJ-class molecular chaperone
MNAEVPCTCITAHDRAVCIGWCRKPCPDCAGQGWYVDSMDGEHGPEPVQRQCEECGGAGEVRT